MMAIAASHAWAAPEPEPLNIRLTVHKIVIVDGREKLVPADAAQPGDLLEYRAGYRNTGKTPGTQVVDIHTGQYKNKARLSA